MDFAVALKSPGVIWFIIGLVLMLTEFTLPGLIIFFFGIGAWITAASYFVLHNGLTGQLTIFLITSLISLVLFRKSLKAKLFKTGDYRDNEGDEYVGQQAVVTEHIAAGQNGKVKFHGTSWIATSSEEIGKGETVVIEDRNNLTLTVRKFD